MEQKINLVIKSNLCRGLLTILHTQKSVIFAYYCSIIHWSGQYGCLVRLLRQCCYTLSHPLKPLSCPLNMLSGFAVTWNAPSIRLFWNNSPAQGWSATP